MSISVIVPTKDRPSDLCRLLDALVAQTYLPDQIVIVDQGAGPESHQLMSALSGTPLEGRYIYVHNCQIRGPSAARNVGIALASGDLIIFLDDDIVPSPDCFAELASAFAGNPDYVGIGGVEEQMEGMALLEVFYYETFFRGVFRDRKYIISRRWRRLNKIQPVSGIKSCLAAFRRAYLVDHYFDERFQAPLIEDLDICWQARGVAKFGIWPKAIGWHKISETGRLSVGRSYRAGAAAWMFFYAKHLKGRVRSLPWFIWLCLGLLVNAARKSASLHSAQPLRGLFAGWMGAMRGFRDIPEIDLTQNHNSGSLISRYRESRCISCQALAEDQITSQECQAML